MSWLVLFFSFFATAKTDLNPWGRVNTPMRTGFSQIYGSYTSGCLTSAETLELGGTGYEVVNPYRNRYYAHASLVRTIKNLGTWANSNKIGKVIIGDIAQPAGGPLTGAHKSHQIGLDADIRIHMLGPGKTATTTTRRMPFRAKSKRTAPSTTNSTPTNGR